MHTTTAPTPTTTTVATAAPRARSLWLTGAVAGVAGSVPALASHLIAKVADVPLSVKGEEFPVLAFPQVTLMSTVVGVVIAIVATRRSARPRRTFVVTTVVLALLSLIAPLALDTDTATKVTLEIGHVVAAAVVIPVMARKLALRRP